MQTQQTDLIRTISFHTTASGEAEQAVRTFLGMPLTPRVRRLARQRLLAVLAEPYGEWTVDTSAMLDERGHWRIQLTPPARPARDTLRASRKDVLPRVRPFTSPSAPSTSAAFEQWEASTSRAIIDRAERKLWLKTRNGVQAYPVAVGRPAHATPLGRRTVQSITPNPVWYPTPGMHRDAARNGRKLPRQVPPGPANPLGSHFIALGNSIGIHGTNAPSSVGRAVSRGCIRMHPDDILTVAAALQPGDAVWIVPSLVPSLQTFDQTP